MEPLQYAWPEWQTMLSSIGIALVLGALIGYDRERRDKPAGLRTHSLVSVASTLAMMSAIALDPGDGNDAVRGVGAIMTGIGFLGAGAIILRGETIHGLKTGATIWTAGAIGVAVGSGWYAGAVVTAMTVSIIMVALTELKSVLPPQSRSIRLSMRIPADEPFPVELINRLQEIRFEVESISMEGPDDDGNARAELTLSSPADYAPEVAASVAEGLDVVSDVHYEVCDPK